MRVLSLGFALLALLPGAATAQGGRPLAAHGLPLFDARDAPVPAGPARAVAASARVRGARQRLTRRLGPQGVLRVDPSTGTLRLATRLDGTLSGPAQAAPAAVALRYARDHAAALGLSASDVSGLRLASTARTPGGLTTLHFAQRVHGVPLFGNGLIVGVDRAGRVMTVSGSPAHLAAVPSLAPAITAAQARRAAGRATHAMRSASRSAASLVLFVLNGEARLGWQVVSRLASGVVYRVVVDAHSGRLLYRANLTRYASATTWPYYPGGPGATSTTPLPPGWLDAGATTLTGPTAHAYSDVNDNDQVDSGEEVQAAVGNNFTFGFHQFSPGTGLCGTLQCSWDASDSGSWPQNRTQTTTQLFWFVNTFHDHLADPHIGFSTANHAPVFESSDRLRAESDDGANGTAAAPGLPDGDHVNNANMFTPPDGASPRMQMYLFRHSASEPFNDVSGADDAAIVYHEYTHGLSSRLVTTSDGWEALDTAQAGAMGEAWSDWYAMDFLVAQGLQPDTAAPGEVDLGAYTDASPNEIRTQPLDCPVGSADPKCPGTPGTGPGGYTYGNIGRVAGLPEVHSDGEIWGETLWDIRSALGSQTAEQLITDGMRLSPPQPSFLDMRDAILAADNADFGGSNQAALWNVFRQRGMGFYASTTDSEDTSPIADFSGPPAAGGPTGAVAGHVRDADTGLPLTGVLVGFGGHMSNPANPGYLAGTSGADGSYSVTGVPTGRYPELVVSPPAGYDDAAVGNVDIAAGATTAADLLLDRDWAAAPGGAQLIESSGASASGCGPSALVDQSLASGWSADRPTGGSADPSATVQLPKAITMSTFAIDPGPACGDGSSAGLRTYRLEVSPDGQTWTQVPGPTFSTGDGGHLNDVNLDQQIDGVRFVRLTLLSAQGPFTPGHSALHHVDVSELTVYGAPPNELPSGTLKVPSTATPGQQVTLDASSFTDPDSAITGYAWDFNGDGTIDARTASATIAHAYAAGNYSPSVTVGDYRGDGTTASAAIAVADAPVPQKPVAPAKPRIVLPRQTRRGAVLVRVTCASRCTAGAQLTVTGALARALHLGSRKAGSRTVKLTGGTRRLVISLNASVRRRLHLSKRRSAAIVITLTVRDSAGQRVRLVRTVQVLRP